MHEGPHRGTRLEETRWGRPIQGANHTRRESCELARDPGEPARKLHSTAASMAPPLGAATRRHGRQTTRALFINLMPCLFDATCGGRALAPLYSPPCATPLYSPALAVLSNSLDDRVAQYCKRNPNVDICPPARTWLSINLSPQQRPAPLRDNQSFHQNTYRQGA